MNSNKTKGVVMEVLWMYYDGMFELKAFSHSILFECELNSHKPDAH